MFVLLLVFWEGNNLWNVQCNLLKWKLQDNPVSNFQTMSCNRQLAWYIPLIHWLPTTGYREEPGKQMAQSSVRIQNTSAALHWMEWWVYSWCKLANLFSRSNYRSPGHSEQQFLLWCLSTVNSRQQQNNTNVLVIYNAVIAVLKEEAAQPSKCLLFLPPWHTANVRSLCSEDLEKKKTLTII